MYVCHIFDLIVYVQLHASMFLYVSALRCFDYLLRTELFFSLVYRIDDTIRIVDTLIRYTIRIVIRIVSFIQ